MNRLHIRRCVLILTVAGLLSACATLPASVGSVNWRVGDNPHRDLD